MQRNLKNSKCKIAKSFPLRTVESFAIETPFSKGYFLAVVSFRLQLQITKYWSCFKQNGI